MLHSIRRKGSLHGTKKRKTPSKIKIKPKCVASVKEQGDEDCTPPKKKLKRQRVSEVVVQDAATKMLVVLIKNFKDDIKEVPLNILAASIKSKAGKPYTNYRSDAIQEGLKLLSAQNKAEKFWPGAKTGNIGAGGSGATILEASKIIWKKLEDGKAYSRKELEAVTNSSCYEAIVKFLNEMNIVKGKGKMDFTSRVFSHGRPK